MRISDVIRSVHQISCSFFFQAEDGIRDLVRSRGLGDVYKRQVDMPITLYGRENSSGTYEFFKEHVLGKVDGKQVDYSPSTQVLQGTAALGEAVARDVKGIGYGGVGYFAERNDIKILHIKKT